MEGEEVTAPNWLQSGPFGGGEVRDSRGCGIRSRVGGGKMEDENKSSGDVQIRHGRAKRDCALMLGIIEAPPGGTWQRVREGSTVRLT